MAAAATPAVCSLLILLFLCFITVEAREHAAKFHVAFIESLLPSSSCSKPTAPSASSRVTVVHRHGPCSPPAQQVEPPSHMELLRQDQVRVDAIHRRATVVDSMAATLPAITGTALGTGNYIASIGLGTPATEYSVVFDTGSDLTWIQCLPCQTCYTQHESLFDPSKSSTFVNISCSSSYCSKLERSSCSTASMCQYQVEYGDNSQTRGSFVQDSLKFSSDSIPNFRYGCGHESSGLFGKAAGLLGLGRDAVSIVSQTAQQYGKVFSYCLPSRSSTTGYLTLGNTSVGAVQYTPMLSDPTLPSFYFLRLVGIAVGGQRLAVSPVVFSTSGTLLDSGTVITRLPPSAYTALRDSFRQLMVGYSRAPALSILETCYDFTGYTTVKVPTVGLLLDSGVTVNIDFTGILYVTKVSQACLAFAGNTDPSDVAIIGNVQQRRFNVVYDVANLKIGFGANGCS